MELSFSRENDVYLRSIKVYFRILELDGYVQPWHIARMATFLVCIKLARSMYISFQTNIVLK